MHEKRFIDCKLKVLHCSGTLLDSSEKFRRASTSRAILVSIATFIFLPTLLSRSFHRGIRGNNARERPQNIRFVLCRIGQLGDPLTVSGNYNILLAHQIQIVVKV